MKIRRNFIKIGAKNNGFDQKATTLAKFANFQRNCRRVFCWKIDVWAVQKHVNLADLVKSFRTNFYFLLPNVGVDTAENEPSKILKFGCRPTTDRGPCREACCACVQRVLKTSLPDRQCISELQHGFSIIFFRVGVEEEGPGHPNEYNMMLA